MQEKVLFKNLLYHISMIVEVKVLIYLNLQMKPLNGNIVLDVLKIWEYPLPEKEKLKNQMI